MRKKFLTEQRFKCKNKTTKVLNENMDKYFYNSEVEKTFLIID